MIDNTSFGFEFGPSAAQLLGFEQSAFDPIINRRNPITNGRGRGATAIRLLAASGLGRDSRRRDAKKLALADELNL